MSSTTDTPIPQQTRPAAATTPASPSGWAVFAGILLLLGGGFNVIMGLTALFRERVFAIGPRALIVWSYTTWGWIHLALGLVMIATALGLFAAMQWARWAGVAFAMLNAVGQVAFITAYPAWSLLVIAVDVAIIYHLTVKYETVA